MQTQDHGRILLGALLAISLSAAAVPCARAAKDFGQQEEPEVTIPFCARPPVIDGVLGEEWTYAAAISMLEAYKGSRAPRAMRVEQPIFFLCWDEDNLYVAMESIDSNSNGIVGKCLKHDHLSLIGDDCLELAIGPGAGAAIHDPDFPTFYLAGNSIGTVWDARIVQQRKECHNSWESGAEIAHEVDGTYWSCEVRIPFRSLAAAAPTNGTVWRMNFDRTYYGYQWSAWFAGGTLNDARIAGNVTFAKHEPAVRLLSVDELANGRLKINMAVANGTDRPQQAKLAVRCQGAAPGQPPVAVGQAEAEVTLQPGEIREITLGRKEPLAAQNKVVIEGTSQAGRRLFFIERDVLVPAPRFARQRAPKVPLVYIFPRFLPSLDRLAVLVDYSAWAKKAGYVAAPPSAQIRVFPEGRAAAPPALEGVLTEFDRGKGTWRVSTEGLPEGNYVVRTKVVMSNGDVLVEDTDWFEKRVFDWMKNPRGVGDQVPPLYSPLAVKGREVCPWGRSYRFGETGLPESVVSQGRELLNGPATLQAEMDGQPADIRVAEPFEISSAKPVEVRGASALSTRSTPALKMDLQWIAEYDGFLLCRLTLQPETNAVTVNRLRLRVPLRAEYARFFSAAGDTQGVTVLGDVVPQRQGKIFDSAVDTRSVCCSPTFATLYWVGDHETCFCYAADNDRGWVLRDDAPAVDVYREGESLVLWLNLVDREFTLTTPRTLEFAFQAGPVKALPKGWRGIQYAGDPQDMPVTVVSGCGGRNIMRGGGNIMHPGLTEAMREESRAAAAAALEGGATAVVGYHWWGHVPKGLPETRVFRGEWGIDKATWEAAQAPLSSFYWENRLFGEDRDMYVVLRVNPVPSYVDFITCAYDETLKATVMSGFYDDTGYPKEVYDEELGIGFVREDGREVSSSGLWIYRERWKRAAYLNFLHGRPNYLCDSQHCAGHFMPAYGFAGLWTPCEHAYNSPFPGGTLERYVALNPSRAFGQVAGIGMESPEKKAALLARDTRCMMMLALINGQDMGSVKSWLTRDLRTACRLRHARNRIQPWEDEVTFTGYWVQPPPVAADAPSVVVSAYHRPDQLLLIAGNTGDQPATATLTPDWARFRLQPDRLVARDAETGQPLALQAGASGQSVQVAVPPRDVRLVWMTPATGPWDEPRTGDGLRPRAVVPELSDPLRGTELSAGWDTRCHEGNAGAWMLDGLLCVQGHAHGYAHVRRNFGVDGVSVQCLILQAQNQGGGGLILLWPNGASLQARPWAGRCDYVPSSGRVLRAGELPPLRMPGWYPFAGRWVRITLSPDTFIFHRSVDGETWTADGEIERHELLHGAPQYVLLGTGQAGAKPCLENLAPAFSAAGATVQTFYADLLVGRGGEQP